MKFLLKTLVDPQGSLVCGENDNRNQNQAQKQGGYILAGKNLTEHSTLVSLMITTHQPFPTHLAGDISTIGKVNLLSLAIVIESDYTGTIN